MTLDEYRSELLEELKISAEHEMNDVETEFVKYVTNVLIDAEEIDDFNEGYFEAIGIKNRKMQMEGYYLDPYDKSCVILTSDFSSNTDITNLTATEINKLYDNMRTLIECSLNGYIINKGFEESSYGFGFAKDILEQINNIVKFRFYIITDKQLSDRVKNIKKEPIGTKPVELNVWDIKRLHNIHTSKLGKESIEIDFTNIGGLSSVKATDDLDYSAYLSIIPGDVLANMYIEHGSRLLEGNVRSFLSIRGKVNKGIRNTILNSPNMFFAYNNGIAATASEVSLEEINGILKITKIKDLQIINGGQTTASIANAVLHDKKDVSNISVPMKLSVVNDEKATEMVPTISRCANSQNKVDEADFFSNHPFHVRIEEYSRKTFAPATNGNQYQTIWFYERARGQYIQEQMKLTLSERKKYQLKNPKNQVLKKVDIAKYINTFNCLPHIVSKGAQTSMRHFAEIIDKEWNKSDTTFNEHYYKKIISYAIIFKDTEILVSNQQWYKEIKAYRANIVTYSLSIISYILKKDYPNKSLNFKLIWNNQKIYSELELQLLKTTKEVLDFITCPSRLTLNVTEWCKKEVCWDRAQKHTFDLTKDFIDSLIDNDEEINEQKDAKKDRKIVNELNCEIEVINLGEDYWKKVLNFGNNNKLLTPIEQDLLIIASQFNQRGKIPSSKQSKMILEINERLLDEGMPKF